MDSEELTGLDDFLRHWDSFAQGREGTEHVRAHQQEFYNRLVEALSAGNKHAVPRCMMFFFVQVFFFLPENSSLYPVLHDLSNGGLEARVIKGKGRFLDSAQMWTWWQDHSAEYPEYELLREWMTRPFTKETVLPQYERLAQRD